MAKGYKTGGRQKGVGNKITRDVRQLMSDILCKELSNIDIHLESVDHRDRLDFIVKLLPYVIPKYDNLSYESIPQDKDDNIFDQLNKKLMGVTQ